MPLFEHAGLNFHYFERGSGLPFFFQHGLGGDVNQTFGLFQPPLGVRLITFDCRGHGETRPLGDPAKISIPVFAEDLLAVMDYLKIQRAIIGGVSMGAAIAQNFVLRFPNRVMGLVLSRQAWLDRPHPKNVAVFSRIAQLIRQHGAVHGREVFVQSEKYREMLRDFPATANSLLTQFDHPRADETVVKLERIPNDAPNQNLSELAKIQVPTLVLANRRDLIHPFEYGQIVAQAIPNAEFKEVTSKSVSHERHEKEVQRFIEDFLNKHFLERVRSK